MSGGLAHVHGVLMAALVEVSGLSVAKRPGQALNPPAAYVGPPSLTWDGFETHAREGVFEVVLAAPATDRAVEVLYAFLPRVVEALDTIDRDEADVVVKSAEPGVWQSGTISLPCYFIRVEAALSDGST
jgi:hypothetical protein